jgi:predicted nucleic acid-binding protein
MVLCDTNIFIHAFNGEAETIQVLKSIGLENIVLSSITIMELYQGMRNKQELQEMKRRIGFYDIIHLDSGISERAISLITEYRLKHHLQIPDAIIGASAIEHDIVLFTYNVKDFNFMPGIKLFK